MGVVLLLLLVLSLCGMLGQPLGPIKVESGSNTGHDYRDALSKSILFFEGQRSGVIPSNQRLTWRTNSGLHDGLAENVDLVGGYYDAADNIKFSLPMAFTVTMLSWSVIEYSSQLESTNQLDNARNAIRWATDYLLKTTNKPNVIYAQVGDPATDHPCWERPEDMDTPRVVYQVNATHPGSELAGEIGAALAAASLVFQHSDIAYSKKLLARSKEVFNFAIRYEGSYGTALGSAVSPFYCCYSGFQDELLWGATWLYKATKNQIYLQYILENGDGSHASSGDSQTVLNWDKKYAGVHVLLSKIFLDEKDARLQIYKDLADGLVCSIVQVPFNPNSGLFTPGGLLYIDESTNLQYVTTTSFLFLVYANYLDEASQTTICNSGTRSPQLIRQFSKQQVDYILGSNPMGMSYMVGYGSRALPPRNYMASCPPIKTNFGNMYLSWVGRCFEPKISRFGTIASSSSIWEFPQRPHHRGSSLPSIKDHPQKIGCKDGLDFFYLNVPNPNLLIGAVVGGPDHSDHYADDRGNYAQSEPTTYNNAPLVGSLAYLTSF